MTRRRLPRVAAAVTGLLLAAVALSGCGGSSRPAAGSTQSRALADVRQFLRTYVASDGRVVRKDQGGGTVSEGQGYGLLLAFAAGDRPEFARIWHWTSANLQAGNGLFGYHWAGGRVVDPQPAADADSQIAWALALAGQHWHLAADTASAKRIAIAVAGTEIGYDDAGAPTLAAGSWAVPSNGPVTVEPGYWSYPADVALGRLTGDHRWQQLAAADASHVTALTSDGQTLPADWATIGGGHQTPVAIGAPGGGPAPQTGQDGLRALVWADCASATRPLDAKWWSQIASTASAGPLSRSLSGQPIDRDASPLSDVAAAAAAKAAGHAATAMTLLSAADRIDEKYPTYYGSAWTALGRVLLTTGLIPGCGNS